MLSRERRGVGGVIVLGEELVLGWFTGGLKSPCQFNFEVVFLVLGGGVWFRVVWLMVRVEWGVFWFNREI